MRATASWVKVSSTLGACVVRRKANTPTDCSGLQSPHQSIEAFVAAHRHLYLG